jgi:hypothetical protein
MDKMGFLIIGFFIGGCFSVFIMSLLNAASVSDDRLLGDRQYDEK